MHTPPRTLVIAGDYQTAQSVMRFYALRECSVGWSFDGTGAYSKNFDWCAADQAVRMMEGARYGRIIIAGDWMRTPYVRWRLPVGGWVGLWYSIQTQVALGAKRVWA